ncbi:DNA-dependent ATPase protein rad54 [Saitoella coloradoensis]
MRRSAAPSQATSIRSQNVNPFGTPIGGKLSLPFRTPQPKGSPLSTRDLAIPARKRRKVNYTELGGGQDTEDGGAYQTTEEEDRAALLDVTNKYPVFTPKPKEVAFKKQFSTPLIKKEDGQFRPPPPSLGMIRKANFVPRPLHDPVGEFAIVLYDPTIDDLVAPPTVEEATKVEDPNLATGTEEVAVVPAKNEPKVHKSLADILGIKKNQEVERPKVPVVIDPRLTKVLRPHQVEGVKFLYKCATGRVVQGAYGSIMADEMGLGKTLQCITLLWTLLRQSPEAGKPTISKAVIACPSSLVRNWANELVKWLGKDTVTPLAVDGKGTKEQLVESLQQWRRAEGRQIVRPVLIISYESLRLNIAELQGTEIGLMLCDEGHRLKNGESQTFTALDSLKCTRRVILSGTPIQNDLSEYFSLLNFANPGLLGSRMEFRKSFEIAILRGRDADATDADKVKGDQKLAELGALVNKFIIRRTNDILSKYLPVKYEHVVFCGLSPLQESLYKHFVASPEIRKLLKGTGSQPLKAIGMLKKLCNHPELLDLPNDLEGCEKLLPEDWGVDMGGGGRGGRGGRNGPELKTWYSGKMIVLDRMLARIRAETNDKIVLISNYTQTLDLFEKLCRSRRYGSLRLDGTMNVNKRQKLVDRFNNPEGEEFVFLLSSKAGGCGLNLIGANRLILFDPDWNPAADQQALARVWRDGQKKDCFVYRFIATGTIEEKIFQRQSMKQNLSSAVVDSNEDVERHFSMKDLRELFMLNQETISDTHDTFKCKRCVKGKQFAKAPAMLYGDTSSWNHFTRECLKGIQDLLLRQEAEEDVVSMCFQYISH